MRPLRRVDRAAGAVGSRARRRRAVARRRGALPLQSGDVRAPEGAGALAASELEDLVAIFQPRSSLALNLTLTRARSATPSLNWVLGGVGGPAASDVAELAAPTAQDQCAGAVLVCLPVVAANHAQNPLNNTHRLDYPILVRCVSIVPPEEQGDALSRRRSSSDALAALAAPLVRVLAFHDVFPLMADWPPPEAAPAGSPHPSRVRPWREISSARGPFSFPRGYGCRCSASS